MTGIDCGTGLAMAVLALALAGPATAQESLDAGKTGAQLFASDCALCHKSPQGLTKSGGLFGLSGFLRQHYTASQETANVVAKYLESLDNVPPSAAKRTGPTKRAAKGNDKGNDKAKDDKAKSDEKKPDEAKSPEKPTQSKATESRPDAAKPAKPKADAVPADKPEKSD
jgi:hypothetical protein